MLKIVLRPDIILLLSCQVWISTYVLARPEIPDSDYYPLAIGNSWTYTGSHDSAWLYTSLVQDSARIDGHLVYFIHTTGSFNEYIDTVSADDSGHVWTYTFGKFYPKFDFTHDSGNVSVWWSDSLDTMYLYTVRNFSFTVHAGNFANCLSLAFDVPRWIDEERFYIFAPGVGMILESGAWTFSELLRAEILDVREKRGLPSRISLEQNFPNPFNPYTTIRFSIPRQDHVVLEIRDLLGRRVSTLADGIRQAGSYAETFNADAIHPGGYTSGTYFYRLIVGNQTEVRKMLILR